MSSVQQRSDLVVTDDLGLAHAELGTNAEELNNSLDLEGIGSRNLASENIIEVDRVKTNPGLVEKRSVQHPISRAAERSAQKLSEEGPVAATTQPTPALETAANVIKEGKLRVAKPVPVIETIAVEKTTERAQEQLSKTQQISVVSETSPNYTTAEALTFEAPAIPAHLLEKLNLQVSQIQSAQVIEPANDLSIQEPELLQAERTSMTVEQAMKLDLSLAKIGTGQTIKPLSFRGHSLSSGTMLDRLITAIANFIKRLEMRFISFLTRKRIERKALKAKPVKVVVPTEEDGLHQASFSNSLSRSRKKRSRWLERIKWGR
jgi:hypothetical protein